MLPVNQHLQGSILKSLTPTEYIMVKTGRMLLKMSQLQNITF